MRGRPIRVLISVRPYHGHFHSIVPLARALEAAGHRVAVATGDHLATSVIAAGLAWIPAGIHPDLAFDLFDEDVDPDYGPEVVSTKVQDLIDIMLGEFRPDVVIRDPTDHAAVLAAEIFGIPCITFGICHFFPVKLWKSLGVDRFLGEVRADFGLRADPKLKSLYRDLYLSIVPPALDLKEPLPVSAVQRIRYRPWDGADTETIPAWLTELPDRPNVLVTLGTVFNDELDLFRTFLAALADEDVNVIVTLGADQDAGLLGTLPPNTRAEGYVPHSLLLPACQAMLCHMGFNTMMGALSAGVPLVGVPIGSDQEHNAARCDALGLGVYIPLEEATPARIRSEVRRVLDDTSFADRVTRFAAGFAALPGLPQAVRRVERVAARGRPRILAHQLLSTAHA